jgi:hypothetical protein
MATRESNLVLLLNVSTGFPPVAGPDGHFAATLRRSSSGALAHHQGPMSTAAASGSVHDVLRVRTFHQYHVLH